jgi:hypothetical protein
MAEEGEISKRIDDLHRRFDDFRADMSARFAVVDQRFAELRQDMNSRFTELREDMNARFGLMDQRFVELRGDMNARFKTLTWLIMVWFSFLTLLTVIFKFLRF